MAKAKAQAKSGRVSMQDLLKIVNKKAGRTVAPDRDWETTQINP